MDAAADGQALHATGGRPRDRMSSHRCSTFVRHDTDAMLACDFCVTITAGFRTLYVLSSSKSAHARIVHWYVTEHPTAEWTVQ